MNPPLVVLVGPTASGKTALACDLAEHLRGEVISADSQQCYRGLDVGTAKPTREEQARAPHHLLDVAEPEEQLDAAAFVRLADAAIADVARRGRTPIVVGGTGLWVRALLRGLVDAPGRDPAFRAELRTEFETYGVPAVHARLARVDPEAARAILPNDRVRIERALEVHALTGRKLSELHREHAFAAERYPSLTFFLDPPRDVLRERIDRRTHAFFAAGALERETRWLLARIERQPAAARALKIIGYGECARALETGDFARAEVEIRARTHRYAKRQRTWFAAQTAERVSHPPEPGRLLARARDFLAGAGAEAGAR